MSAEPIDPADVKRISKQLRLAFTLISTMRAGIANLQRAVDRVETAVADCQRLIDSA